MDSERRKAHEADLDETAGWTGLEQALIRAGGPSRGAADLLGRREEVEWALREARMLVLDGRATTVALADLAQRHAFGAWATLRDCARGTAGHVLAVLLGWDLAGVQGTGHARDDRPGGFPDSQVEVAAVWCAAAADRLGLDQATTTRWAQAGLLSPTDAPDPGWQADPDDGPDADPAPGPEDDPVYRRLQQWLRLVGARDAPVCHCAGLDPEDGALVLAMPHRHPDRRGLLGY